MNRLMDKIKNFINRFRFMQTKTTYVTYCNKETIKTVWVQQPTWYIKSNKEAEEEYEKTQTH